MSHSQLKAVAWRTTRLLAAIATTFASAHGGDAQAAGLNYVDGSAFANITPSSAINLTGLGTAGDNVWGTRTDFGSGVNLFESGGSLEDSPELVQRVSGLTPGANYDFYAVFWTDKDENWGVRTGLSSGALAPHTYSSDLGNNPYAGSMKAVTAGAAVWDAPPQPGVDGISVFTQRPGADPLIMLLGKAGSKIANASGEVDVYIDDLPAITAGAQRSWFDGVAYVAAGTTVALTANIDRTTGVVTIANPTSTPFQIKSYSLNSVAGSLNGPNWSTIAGQLDGAGNGSFDSDLWNVTVPANPASTPYATVLSEMETAANNNVGGALAADGGTLNFGNIWSKSHFQDVRIELTLADGTLVAMYPDYTGTAIAAADFNVDGAVTLADYQTLLTNVHSNVSTLTQIETNRLGDMTRDRVINFNDFSAFRLAYDEINGVGAFAQMVAEIPEPSSFALLLAAGVMAFQRARRRAATASAAVALTCVFASASSAAPLLSVDVNDRDGDQVAGPPGDNTVAGFSPFTLTPSTTGGQPNSTGTIGSYTITVTAVNAAGNVQGAIDDRDRAQPTGTPTLNQLYDDFIFTAVGVGVGGGIDMTIDGGGALQPDKFYAFSLYSYDNSSTGAAARTANWLDGNVGNAIAMLTSHVGTTLPTTDDRYKFTGYFKTDATGKLFLRGRNSLTTTDASVIVNGFQILEVSEAPTLTLEVDTSTGAMRFINDQAVNLDMSYYEIRSASGALNHASWNSFDDGEGSDPVGTSWDEATSSTANILSEMNLNSSRLLTPGSFSSLGNAYTPGSALDVRFLFAAPGGGLQPGIVNYVQSVPSTPGDFNHNGVVDGNDLTKWKGDFGVNALSDADNDGDSDGNDFLMWQRNFGTGASSPTASAVPEPAAASLIVLVAGGFLLKGRRQR